MPSGSDDGAQAAGFSAQPPAPETDCKPLPLRSFRSQLTKVDTNQFEVHCKNIQAVAVKQKEDFWCWAACAEMLDRYRGIRADQTEIVERIKNQTPSDDKSQSGSQVEIWLAMNPEMQREWDQRQIAWHKPNQIDLGIHFNINLKNLFALSEKVSSDQIVEELSAGNPILMGLRGGQWGDGHIVLVYGATYSRLDPTEKPAYRYVGVPIPRQANPNTIQLPDLFKALTKPAGDDNSPHYSIASMQIVDPQTGTDPLTGLPNPQLSTLTDDKLVGFVDFFIGRTAAAEKLKEYMQTAMPTPQEIQQQQQQRQQQQRQQNQKQQFQFKF